ncbi:hypothetical protein [bacterium endosymbiont of Bathymodiolus sp. 5 South]|uniref:hypothetical protein n=1 Tax=bacterium endosymbiont of Bathymodiolus sp. 5 South TaxID=1181670 RepID=UPI00111B59F3|nr:hypothetical protein [bacterium endosymbiont of Bathymodiolus sp. 5 South]
MNNHQKSMMGNYLKHNPVVAVAIILLALISLAVYSIMHWDEHQIAQYIQVDDCQIAKTSCIVALDKDTSIKVNILPRGIPETDTLSIFIDTQGERIDTASIVFEGIEIDTITPEYRLYKKNDTHFSGKGFLAICSLSKMHWIAHIIVIKDSKVWKISFPFEKNILPKGR